MQVSKRKRESKEETIKFTKTVEGRQSEEYDKVWSPLNIYKMIAGYKSKTGESSSCIS